MGGDESIKKSRTEDIMADSAYLVLTSPSKTTTGNYFIYYNYYNLGWLNTEEIWVTDFKKYQVDKNIEEKDLLLDFFV